MQMTTNLITREQAAQYLGITRQYLDVMAMRKQGPSYIRLGRAVRYELDDVKAWAKARKVAL